MHRATITISSETIVDLAQCTLIPSGIKCEWVVGGRDPCPAVLVCWHALKQVSGKLPKISDKSYELGKLNLLLVKALPFSCFCLSVKKAGMSEIAWLFEPIVILSYQDEVMFMLYSKMQCTDTCFTRCVAKAHRIVAYGSYQPFVSDKQWVALPISPRDVQLIGCCPACGPPRQIYRPNTLVKHFLDEHADLNGVSVPGALNPLRPLWTPFSPLKSFPAPPPLPSNSPPGCVLVISSPSIMRKKIPSSTSSVSVLPLSPFLTPRKQAQRQIPRKEQAEDVQKSDELSIPEFDDLPGFSMPESGGEHDFIVWRQPFHMDVSRPQRMVDAPLQEPPISILFDVFAKRVDELRP